MRVEMHVSGVDWGIFECSGVGSFALFDITGMAFGGGHLSFIV